MPSLFNPSDNAEMIARIDKLTPSTQHQWGKMDVAQMMAHCSRPYTIAVGELKLKRSFMGLIFGKIAKKKLTGPEPFGKNLPTDKKLVVADERNYDIEKKNLIAAIQKFGHNGPSGLSQEPHPFFGEMTPDEWDRLMWKHTDHHLRQFGV